MDVLETLITYPSRQDVFELWYLTDIHWGERACDETLLRQTVKRIKANKNARWWLGGDPCGYIGIHDEKRWDAQAVAPWISIADLDNLPTVQALSLTDALAPIAGQCLGVGIGNHDESIRLRHDQNVHKLIIGYMNQKLPSGSPPIRSTGYSAFHIVRFQRGVEGSVKTLVCYLHHGYFGGRLKGNKANKLKEIFQAYDCDVIFTGHNHDRIGFPDVRLHAVDGADGPRIEKKYIACINCGAFLKTLADPGDAPTYSEKKGYLPTLPGPIVLEYKPESGVMKVIQ